MRAWTTLSRLVDRRIPHARQDHPQAPPVIVGPPPGAVRQRVAPLPDV
ncbi:hypothetical protein [Corynebacterium guangdongense]|uniref:Uncharacterized protein n=1 Tax=Corynebacterium guangdongense TaxID=1783348 RepID=A0ABU1ZWP0_9CORY|nr:hypothetical protein [Corynebacterium guangdongense]MDR7328338.1 hypothetical protein [Corynebacterium guangdongense]